MAGVLAAGALTVIALLATLALVQRWRRRRAPDKASVRVLAVLGSGGHTAEMLRLLPSLCANEAYSRIDFVLAETDTSSRASAERLQGELARAKRPLPPIAFHTIPRSREVGQSYASSVLTTLRATASAIATVVGCRSDLILCNGPGTCLPVCVIARASALVMPRATKIVYVESVARVRTLSLTGRIVWRLGLADGFFVQWHELTARYPGSTFLGRLC